LAIPTATDLKNALRNSPYTSGNITVTNSLGTVSWTVTVGDFAGTTGNGGCTGLTVGATGTTTTVTGTPTSAGPSAAQSATCGTGNAAGSTFTLQASDVGSGPVGPGTATATFRVRVFGTWLYVADPGADTVEVIDSTSNAHVATLTLTAGDNPHSVAVTPDGSRAFVTLEGSDEVLVINTFDNTSLGTVDISLNPAGNVDACTGPRGIAIGKAGNALNRAYVACTSGDVDVLDVTAAVGAGMRIETVNSVSSGGEPRDLAVNPAGTFVYVSMSGDRHIEKISTVAGTLAGTELTDVMPATFTDMRGVMFSADGARLYIAEQVSDDIHVLETATDTVNAGLAITFVAGNPERMALSADGTRVFVTFSGTVEQLVVIVDGATPAQDTGSPVALTANDDAIGVAAPPSGGRVYLALSGADAVGRRNNTTPFASAGANIALPSAGSVAAGMAAMPIPQ
jgi:YVTN family beta-propeller protein